MMGEWFKLFLGEIPLTPELGDSLTDEEALKLAIVEGFRGFGFTSPNPAVGCVILDSENNFLLSGYHAKAGEAHAEINALEGLAANPIQKQDATGWDLTGIPTEKLRGARVFVTLEPCAHEGRTPSCAKTLAKFPIAEVMTILRDPFPQVSGRGFQILQTAGIKVKCLEDEETVHSTLVESARALCEFFLVNVIHNRPMVSLKVATSLDGMMALKNGQSQWITNELSRRFARFLRSAHDSVLVGKHTILKDNPRLDARDTAFEGLDRKVVILDTHAEILNHPDLTLFKVHRPEDIFVCVGPQAQIKVSAQAQIIQKGSFDRSADWKDLMKQLWDRQIRSVWVEGGASTLSSALSAGVGDRLWLFQGPHLIGGASGRTWTETWGHAEMDQRLSLGMVRHLALESDHLTTGRLFSSKT